MTVTNPYYEFAPSLTPGTTARAGDVNTQLQLIQNAFDFMPGDADAITTGTVTFAPETGAGNAYDVTMPDTRTINQDGDEVMFFASHPNTGAATLNVDGIGAVTMRDRTGALLTSGDIVLGRFYVANYDATNSRFVLDVTANVVTNVIDEVQGTSTDDPGAPGLFDANLSYRNAVSQLLAEIGFNGDIAYKIFNRVRGGNVQITGTSIAGNERPIATFNPETQQLVLPLSNDAVTPSFAFGDGDTGFYSPSDDAINMALSGISVIQYKQVAGATQMILRQANTPLLPTLAFGDGNSGFYEISDNQIGVAINALARWQFTDGAFSSSTTGPSMARGALSSTAPMFRPSSADINTGLGSPAADQANIIAGGVQVANFTEAAGVVQMILPLQNAAATPSLAFGDGDTGFYEESDDQIGVAINGISRMQFNSTYVISGIQDANPALMLENVSNINPTVVSRKNDPDSGLGSAAADQLSLIAGGVEMLRLVEGGTSASSQLIIGPATIIGTNATPSLAFGDGDTGFSETIDDTLNVAIAGSFDFSFSSTGFGGTTTNASRLLNVSALATVPNIVPISGDTNTGVGSGGADDLTLIAGGVDCINIAASGGARQIGFYTTSAISLQTGVAVTAAGVHAALVALGLITA